MEEEEGEEGMEEEGGKVFGERGSRARARVWGLSPGLCPHQPPPDDKRTDEETEKAVILGERSMRAPVGVRGRSFCNTRCPSVWVGKGERNGEVGA